MSMVTNECSQPASKSSSDSQDFSDVNMVLKMAYFHKSSRPQWVNIVGEKFNRWYMQSNSYNAKTSARPCIHNLLPLYRPPG